MSRFWEINESCSSKKQLCSYSVLLSRWSLHLTNGAWWFFCLVGWEFFCLFWGPCVCFFLFFWVVLILFYEIRWNQNYLQGFTSQGTAHGRKMWCYSLRNEEEKIVTIFPQSTSWKGNFSSEVTFLSGHLQAWTVSGADIFWGSKTEAVLKKFRVLSL